MLINLTPHEVTILDEGNKVLKVIKPSGAVARISTSTKEMEPIDGVKITLTTFDHVNGLPDSEFGTFFIVSQMVKNSPLCIYRKDLLVPSEVVRDNGKILGCKSLGM